MTNEGDQSPSAPEAAPSSSGELWLGPRVLILAVLIAVVVIPPFPLRMKGGFVLESRTVGFVRSSEEGWLEQILVREGEKVRPGQVVAVLGNSQRNQQRFLYH